jgi:hypothetical protein
MVRHGDRIVADTKRPPVLYESGFAPLVRSTPHERALNPTSELMRTEVVMAKYKTGLGLRGLPISFGSRHAERLLRFGMPPSAMISALSCSMVVRCLIAVCRISVKASSSDSA